MYKWRKYKMSLGGHLFKRIQAKEYQLYGNNLHIVIDNHLQVGAK